MKLVSVELNDFKSIQKTKIEFEDDYTCLVGISGSGKTTILKLLETIKNNVLLHDYDLTENSKKLRDYNDGKISLCEIIPISAKFKIEPEDKTLIPSIFKNTNYVTFTRSFDNSTYLTTAPKSNYNHIDIDEYEGKIQRIFRSVKKLLSEDNEHYNSLLDYEHEVLKYIKDKRVDVSSIHPGIKKLFTDIIDVTGLSDQISPKIIKIEKILNDFSNDVRNQPLRQLYYKLPNIEYIGHDGLNKLNDNITVDEYLNNKDNNIEFKAIGIICGITDTAISNIQKQVKHRRDNYFKAASKKLTNEFKKLWTTLDYELDLTLDNNKLVLNIKSPDMPVYISAKKRSEGLQWALKFFFKLNVLAASSGTSNILLFDSPATSVHDDAKINIRRYMAKMSKNCNLQIIYTTHEKALIDSWKVKNIRYVEKTKTGTKVLHEQNNSRNGTLLSINKHIGSPAKYSSLGNPITIYFDHFNSDIIATILNEIFLQSNNNALHKEIYSFKYTKNINELLNVHDDNGYHSIRYYILSNRVDCNKLKKEHPKLKKFMMTMYDIINIDESGMEDLMSDLYMHEVHKCYNNKKILEFKDNKPLISQIINNMDATPGGEEELIKHGVVTSTTFNEETIIHSLTNLLKNNNLDTTAPYMTKTMANYDRFVKNISKITEQYYPH